MRRTVLLSGVVSFIMAFTGTLAAIMIAAPMVADAQGSKITTQALSVVGDDGTDRVRLRTGPGIAAGVDVLGSDGTTTRVQLNAGGGLGRDPGAAGVNVLAADRTQIAHLGTINGGLGSGVSY